MKTQALRKGVLALAASLALAGCQSLPQTEHTALETPPQVADAPLVADAPVVLPQPTPAPVARDLWQRIARQLTWPVNAQPAVAATREAYLAQPQYMEVVSRRAGRYLHYIVEQVEARGMPMEIALVPMVESTLNPFAVSPQRAAGLWQIMPATADHLGMRRSWWFDGRYDVIASTDLALDYLQALHDEFDDDWLLALAAYNAGKGRVRRAQMENTRSSRPRDYWSLRLPRETSHYVPRLLALASIIRDAQALGVNLPAVPNSPAFITVDTAGQIEFLRASQLAGMELRELRSFNPGHLRWATAPDRSTLLLPPDRAEAFASRLATLDPADRVSWQHYRIRSGDSLIRIAKRFNIEVSLLRQVNNVRGSFIRAGDTLMIPSGASWSDSLAMAGASAEGKRQGYRVRPGDSLYLIANRFQVTIDDLITWNSLDPKRYLQPGQRLTLYLGGG